MSVTFWASLRMVVLDRVSASLGDVFSRSQINPEDRICKQIFDRQLKAAYLLLRP